jgi:hypothetical protein
MSVCARITVTSGPDRGKVFELTGEMVRLGKAPHNEVVLSDTLVSDQHASIVRREGRFAIFTPVPEGLEVDGTEVPSERWVWLPETATIRVGQRTSVDFVADGSGDDAAPPVAAGSTESRLSVEAPADGPAARSPGGASGSAVLPGRKSGNGKGRRSMEVPRPGSDAPGRSRRSSGERGEKKSRTIARFITDGPGDPLVKLGEDGHLPELALHEARSGERPEGGGRQSNPLLLFVAIGLSFGMTILMLFMDVGSFGDSEAKKAEARSEIMQYYGAENETLKPYQTHLREARLARSRRDYESERQEYRKVLAQLRSEYKDKLYSGLTGRREYNESSADKKSDQRLEELIGILLGE